MENTVENKIFERMKKAKRGLVFFTSDFVNTVEVYGARENNLKNIDVVIPRDRLTVIEKSWVVG